MPAPGQPCPPSVNNAIHLHSKHQPGAFTAQGREPRPSPPFSHVRGYISSGLSVRRGESGQLCCFQRHGTRRRRRCR